MNVGGLTEPTLDADVFACYLRQIKLIRTACLAKVGITLSDGQITGALFRVALGLTTTSREAILT